MGEDGRQRDRLLLGQTDKLAFLLVFWFTKEMANKRGDLAQHQQRHTFLTSLVLSWGRVEFSCDSGDLY